MVSYTKKHSKDSLTGRAGRISKLGPVDKQDNTSSDEATRAGSVISDSEDTFPSGSSDSSLSRCSEESHSSSSSLLDVPTSLSQSVGPESDGASPASSGNIGNQRSRLTQADLATPVTDEGNPKIPVLCIYNARGRCTNEHNCRFAHGDKELAQVVASISEDRSKVKKTKLCRFFSIGRCLSGPNCLFAHGDDELRGGTVQAAARLGQAKAGSAAPPRAAEHVQPQSKAKVTTTAAPRSAPTPTTIPTPSVATQELPESEEPSARPVIASPWADPAALTQPESEESPTEADVAKWAAWRIAAPPTAPPRIRIHPPPPRESPPLPPVAALTVPPTAPPGVSPLDFLRQAELCTRSDSDDEQQSSVISTEATFTEVASSDICSEEQEVQHDMADDHLAEELAVEQAPADGSPESPLEVAKVERWDEDMGCWVVDFIEIEPMPFMDSVEVQASPSQERPPSRVRLQDLVQAVGIPRIGSRMHAEAERCCNPCGSKSSVSAVRTQLTKLPWYRTPLRPTAARFVPERQMSKLRSSAAMFVPFAPASRSRKVK